MSVLPVGIGSSGGYKIPYSLRFDGSNDYLSRGMATASTTTWTVSFWFKTSSTTGGTAFPYIFHSVETTGAARQCGIAGNDAGATFQVSFYKYAPSTYAFRKIPAMVFRDNGAWYHAVFVWNTTSGVAEDRAQIWINGSRVTQWTTNTNPALNETWLWSMFTNQFIGGENRNNGTLLNPFNGYLSEINFIDGQALTAGDFGYTDSVTGQWRPKKYTGTYGTNGFYLDFKDGASTTTLGYDAAGSNDWTLTNMVRAAGTTDCWMTDTPTNNFITLNPLAKASTITVSNGALVSTTAASQTGGVIGTVAVSTGKWYWEATITGGAAAAVGIAKLPLSAYAANQTGTYMYLMSGEKRLSPSTDTAYGATYTTNDVIGVALDMDAGTVTFYKNNVSQGTAFSSLSGDFTAWLQDGSTGSVASFAANFGQRSFAYTPPAGFKALCTANLPVPSILNPRRHFDVLLHTGDGNTSKTISGLQFQPDFLWVKERGIAQSHAVTDSVRGVGLLLSTNATAAETSSTLYGQVTTINSDGYTASKGTDPTFSYFNKNTGTYVNWLWRANGAAVTNTSGSITSQVSANTTAGFSILTASINSSGGTIGHGLGVAPALIIGKNTAAGSTNWGVWHKALTSTEYLVLNSTAAKATSSTIYNGTSSTTFTVGSGWSVSSAAHVFYCFAEVPGYSRFGSYTGNGSADGPFVWCGFRPRYVMVKCVTASGVGYSWGVVDAARATTNQAQAIVWADSSAAEDTTSTYAVDFTSNGFKVRNTSLTWNASQTYIFIAFAETPFNFALAR